MTKNKDDNSPEYSTDGFLGGKINLRQPKRGFRSGHDAVLLAASVPEAARVCELGCGVGVASLCVGARLVSAHITGIDSDAQWVALATANAADNNMASRTDFICADIEAGFANLNLTPNQYEEVIANPPYYKAGQSPPPPDPQKAHAMISTQDTQEAWVKCAAALLAAKGYLTMVHQPQALPSLLAVLTPRFGDIRVLPILPRIGSAATRILIRAQRDSKAALVLLPPLILQNPDATPTPEAQAILRDGKALAFTPTQG